MTTLADNLSKARDRIAAAARRSGRSPEAVTLIAVTKTHPVDIICEAIALGVTDVGENRVEEAAPKIEAVGRLRAAPAAAGPSAAAVWHMIGHIQSRKAREVAECFGVVHSVASARLAERLGRFAGGRGKVLPAYLECNVSGEPSKSGLAADRIEVDVAQRNALEAEVTSIVGVANLSVRGLMTIAPVMEAPEAARPFFERLRQLRDHLAGRFPQVDWTGLSMGMTDDFEVAIEEGATCVRIGRAIFGERR